MFSSFSRREILNILAKKNHFSFFILRRYGIQKFVNLKEARWGKHINVYHSTYTLLHNLSKRRFSMPTKNPEAKDRKHTTQTIKRIPSTVVMFRW